MTSSTSASPAFPTATIIGYPRIGPKRELKRAVESYWAGRSSLTDLEAAAAQTRLDAYRRLGTLGLQEDTAAIPLDFSYYDQVLDATVLLGAIPTRFADEVATADNLLDVYFLLARGHGTTPPLEMTKWFNTNYHYLVPEIGPDTPLSLATATPVDLFGEAKENGVLGRPTVVGPVTYLLLAKAEEGSPEDFEPIDRLDDVVAAYSELLEQLAEAGAPWVQFDEPAATSDNLGKSEAEIAELLRQAYDRLGSQEKRPAIFVSTPFGEAKDAVAALATTPVEAIHADLVHGSADDLEFEEEAWDGKTLVAGVINGRNIWRANLREKLGELQGLSKKLPDDTRLSIATSTSLQHVPYDVTVEQWDDPELNQNLHLWLAFADQKVEEVVALATGVAEGEEAIVAELEVADQAVTSRQESAGVTVPAVRDRAAGLTPEDRERDSYEERRDAQAKRLNLPPLPTTTIGSFPQTSEIRQARAAHRQGSLTDEQYEQVLKDEIAAVVALQEEIGLDVLVHGEPERNDMVQYFAELLDGFAVTHEGWVQSYGSRCTRPSILWGDVSRPAPMTVKWSTYAQSLTDAPVKGMLTGPVTILAWSFVRDDLPIGEVADQVGLALRDEVADLEAAGIGVIQVDEPALRELLPLRRDDHEEYLDWSVGSFRAATSGVAPETQIHTHLCYSEFGDVIDAIDDLGADVTSLEAARSAMEVLPALESTGFERGVGPGIYDIHSPRVPSVEELAALLSLAVESVPEDRLWVNPDCGLKTRGYKEVDPSLRALVGAVRGVRVDLGGC